MSITPYWGPANGEFVQSKIGSELGKTPFQQSKIPTTLIKGTKKDLDTLVADVAKRLAKDGKKIIMEASGDSIILSEKIAPQAGKKAWKMLYGLIK